MSITKSQRKTLIGVTLLILTTYLVSLYIRKDIEENATYAIGFVNDHMDGPSKSTQATEIINKFLRNDMFLEPIPTSIKRFSLVTEYYADSQ